MNLSEKFNLQEFTDWIEKFLPEFSGDLRKVDVPSGLSSVKSIITLGESALGVRVFVIETEKDPSGRKIGLAKESFNLIKNYGTPNALITYYSNESSKWRLSLLTSSFQWKEGKITKKLSNPKRQSYVLGEDAKTNTPSKYLISKGSVIDLDDLKKRFSLEVVNKDFYNEISISFSKLVGGSVGKGKKAKIFTPLLKLPSVKIESQINHEFGVRLIGRIVFCWFLREKKSEQELPLIPSELLSLESAQQTQDYYHQVLEPLFFEILNKRLHSRNELFAQKPYSQIPYLNGGLFSPDEHDYFSYNEGKQAVFQNTVTVPDSWFQEFVEILETYNFTIDENTSFDEELSIDPEMLGRIFENLLAEINPETGESARKSTGSYYTPRVIVDYMVDESLLLYLKQQTEIEESKLRAIISYDLTDDTQYPLSEAEKQKAINALEKIKILDPACGSGAFPIGALQKMVFILQQIDPDGQLWFKKQIQHTSPEIRRVLEREFTHKNFDYIRKLGVIRENIYGIDIQPIATEISRLRCFLTLVVDERIDDSLENRGIEPLPNLDFKFVTANSLIGLPKRHLNDEKFGRASLFEDDEGIENLKEVRNMFFNASGSERDSLRLQFKQTQNQMLQQLIKLGNVPTDLTSKLSIWDPFSHKASSWFDPEWMFGIKDGFDVVIANPPYIGEKGHKEIFREVRGGNLRDYYLRKMDFFYFFFHLANLITRQDGIICFITTNYFPTATGAKRLRSHINSESSVLNMCNFNILRIFESAKGQHNMITIMKKGYDTSIIAHNFATKEKGVASPDLLVEILSGNNSNTDYFNVSQAHLYDGEEKYIRITGKNNTSGNRIQGVLNKIQGESKLGSLCFINMGVQSGADAIGRSLLSRAVDAGYVNADYLEKNNISEGSPIYIIDNKFFDSLSEAERSIAKPFVKNSDISKYYINETNNYYLYIDSEVDITNYPSIEKHLIKFRPILKAREQVRDEDNSWYWIRGSKRKFLIGTGEHIICPYRAKSNNFALTDGNILGAGDVYYITRNSISVKLKYVLALLNSRLYYLWLYHRGKKKGETLELYQKPLSEIPIKKISKEEQQPFVEMVDKILAVTYSHDYKTSQEKQREVKEYEKQIDKMVYQLYDLTPEEIAIVEGK